MAFVSAMDDRIKSGVMSDMLIKYLGVTVGALISVLI